MTRQSKLTLLFVATIAAGLAEGYFLYPMGLDWLIPGLMITAIFVVLIARERLTFRAIPLGTYSAVACLRLYGVRAEVSRFNAGR